MKCTLYISNLKFLFVSEFSEDNGLHSWNPMEDDFLSQRNLYEVDDEDAGTAFDGFSKFI